MSEKKEEKKVFSLALSSPILSYTGEQIKLYDSEDSKPRKGTVRDYLLILLNSNLPTKQEKESFIIRELGCQIADEGVNEVQISVARISLLQNWVRKNEARNAMTGQMVKIFPANIHAQLMQAVGITSEDV